MEYELPRAFDWDRVPGRDKVWVFRANGKTSFGKPDVRINGVVPADYEAFGLPWSGVLGDEEQVGVPGVDRTSHDRLIAGRMEVVGLGFQVGFRDMIQASGVAGIPDRPRGILG